MATIKAGDIEYYLKLRDEASKVLDAYRKNAKVAASDVESLMDVASAAVKRHGREVGGLTKWIREQRAEQRQHNFLFSQGREIIGAASVALTTLSAAGISVGGSLKQASDAANAGFVAFQGFNNVLGFLPGPMGLIISSAAGLVIGLLKLKDTTEATAAAQERYNALAKEFVQGIGLEQAKRELEVMSAVVSSAEARKKQYQAELDGLKSSRESLDVIRKKRDELPKLITQEEQLISAYNLRVTALRDLVAAEEQQEAVRVRTAGQRTEYLRSTYSSILSGDEALKLHTLTWKEAITLSKEYRSSVVETSGLAALNFKQMMVPLKEAIPIVVDFTEEMRGSQETLNVIMSSMVTGLQAAFEGGVGAGRTFFKSILLGFIDMVQGLIIAAEAAALAKAVPSWGATLITDLPKLAGATIALQLARAMVSKFHTGGTGFVNAPTSQEVPILVRGQEDFIVRTPEQRQSDRQSNSTVVNVNFHAPVSDEQFVIRAIEKAIRRTGLTVDRLLVARNPQAVVVAA
jgi:hypothetical protein